MPPENWPHCSPCPLLAFFNPYISSLAYFVLSISLNAITFLMILPASLSPSLPLNSKQCRLHPRQRLLTSNAPLIIYLDLLLPSNRGSTVRKRLCKVGLWKQRSWRLAGGGRCLLDSCSAPGRPLARRYSQTHNEAPHFYSHCSRIGRRPCTAGLACPGLVPTGKLLAARLELNSTRQDYQMSVQFCTRTLSAGVPLAATSGRSY